MKCSNCGNEYDDALEKCPHCSLDKESSALSNSAEPQTIEKDKNINEILGQQEVSPQEKSQTDVNQQESSSIKGKIGSLIGVVSIIWGFVIMRMNTGRTQSYEFYGGDAYTGIQQATAQTATNVNYLADIVKYGIGGILIIAGAMILLYSVCLLKSLNNNQETKNDASSTIENVDEAENSTECDNNDYDYDDEDLHETMIELLNS